MTWLWIVIVLVAALAVLAGKENYSRRHRSNAGNHWIYHPHLIEKDDYECARCHARFSKQSKSCPKCGASMNGNTIRDEGEWLDEEEELDLICEDD